MTALRRALMLAAGWAVFAATGWGHYHFVHLLNRTSPYVVAPEKFDVGALPNRTVFFYVAEQGPTQLAPGDSFPAVVSEIRAAAQIWNAVDASGLRLAFGGLSAMNTVPVSPRIDVTFDDVPPGLVAMAAPIQQAGPVTGPDGSYVPILRSVMVLRRDLSQQSGSWSEDFFLTLVHEFGHTLGLQHTLTSSVMSTGPTRATTKSRPLTQDDIAGLATLYPNNGVLQTLGSVAGRVTLAGQGVNLASVVALTPGGRAVSSLTNPDGTYRIDGLLPGQYLVYAHPLPPAMSGEVTPANIVLPLDADGRSVSAGPVFETQFFPGTKDPVQALPIVVTSGLTVDGVNFSVQARGPLSVYAVETYSFPGQVAVKPAYLNRGLARGLVVARGEGLVSGGAPTPGLRVSVIGGSAIVSGMRAYPPAPNFLELTLDFNLFSSDGPQHLVFSTDNDIYVLPAGLNLVQRQPPMILAANATFDGDGHRVAEVIGTGLSAETRFFFDGVPARRVVEDNGRFLLTPPTAPGGHRAAVVALNTDGQSSLFLAQNPPVFTYDPGDGIVNPPSPNTVPSGTEAMLEINGVNTDFADGQVAVGFGSGDVTASRVFVVSPTKLLVNAAAVSGAPGGTTSLTVASGIRLFTLPYAVQVQPAGPLTLALSSQVINTATGQSSIYAGSTATMVVTGLTDALIAGGISLTLNDTPVMVTAVPGQITFQVPAGAATGPAVLRLHAGSLTALPIAISIEPPPPSITAAWSMTNVPVDAARPARPGEILSLLVSNLADVGASVSAQAVRVSVNGVDQQVLQVLAGPPGMATHLVQFLLAPATPGGAQPVTVSISGRTSSSFPLSVAAL